MVLQVSSEGGGLLAQYLSATRDDSLDKHLTGRVFVPPPQALLHDPQSPEDHVHFTALQFSFCTGRAAAEQYASFTISLLYSAWHVIVRPLCPLLQGWLHASHGVDFQTQGNLLQS